MNRPPKSTPWGVRDHIRKLCDGIWSCSTPSHGGIFCDEARNAAIPAYMRNDSQWYEEDSAWVIPFIVHKKDINTPEADICERWAYEPDAGRVNGRHLSLVEHTFKHWHPDAWEKFYGKTLKPGESHLRDNPLPLGGFTT